MFPGTTMLELTPRYCQLLMVQILLAAALLTTLGCSASGGGRRIEKFRVDSLLERPIRPVGDQGDLTQASAEEGASENRILSRFYRNEPVYIAVGNNQRLNAKFQVSFKYKFLNPDGKLVKTAPAFFKHLYFGYTQTTLWDLESDSVPFIDTAYRPALFWRDEHWHSWSNEALKLGLEAGYEHESNGQDGPESRSIDTVYAKSIWDWSFSDDDHFVVEPKVWAYLTRGRFNRDIAEFRGYFNLRTKYYDADGLGISSDLRIGKDTDHGYLEVNVTYPMEELMSGEFEGFLFLQYFNGWGETILAHDQKTPSQVRIGFSLTR